MLNPEDLTIEIWPPRSGGMQPAITPTGVKVTHNPTGLIAIADCDRSQHKNKQIALDMITGGLTSPAFGGGMK